MSAPDPQKPQLSAATQPRLLDRVREKIRLLHYSKRTEDAYVGWIRKFILFHDKRRPETMGAPEVEQFLTHLAVAQHVAASTQNQALCAIRKHHYADITLTRVCCRKRCAGPP